MNAKTGILLVNLGTPNTPHPKDVYRYLIEFLTDERVIDYPWLSRQLLVRGLIVPLRYRRSAKQYQEIWTDEGSPLKVYGHLVEKKLQELLGPQTIVKLSMRYQEPSMEKVLDELLQSHIEKLIVLPLFPQYASATTGSVHQKVTEIINKRTHIPELVLVNQFATHPSLIDSFCAAAEPYDISSYDQILFSFHGLPQRHIFKCDPYDRCLKQANCCAELHSKNHQCYTAQCHATARAIAQKLNLSKEQYTICFQSRLGKEPWLQPFTTDMIASLAKQGRKRLLVFAPAFICDCLETTFEIAVEYANEFKQAGGQQLDLVPGLNDHPRWIRALSEILSDYLPAHVC